MPKPYSYDLRQKVMQAIEIDGLKKNGKESGKKSTKAPERVK